MRLSLRWYLLIGLAFLCSFFYSFWRISSFRLQQWGQTQTPGPRLVVFGDSWGDNGLSSGSLERRSGRLRQLQPKSWTDVLCSNIQCEHHDNYAQSCPYSWSEELDGAVVDNVNLNFHSRNKTAPPDMGKQVAKWVSSQVELEKTLPIDEVQARMDRTIFVIHFGFWDIWHVSEIENKDVGHGVIEREVDLLFQHIQKLLDWWGNSTMKIIVPFAVDPTYLPCWKARLHTGRQKENGVLEQRHAVSLVDLWNKRLESSARAQELTEVYLFDTNAFMLDHIRDTQLKKFKVSDSDGLGKATPVWEIVEAACVGDHDHDSPHVADDGETRCRSPEKYMFWDDMHLGAKANELIAKEITDDISGNFASAWVKPQSSRTHVE